LGRALPVSHLVKRILLLAPFWCRANHHAACGAVSRP